MPTTTPNMGMLDPIASTGASGTGDPGPGYATNITAALNTLDAHDHSAGKGVQITPAGMNINADLPVGSNNLTALRSARFTSQASALNLAGDLSEVYVKSGDLWYVNASGQQVQVTAGGGLGTGPVGATGPAGTSFVSNYFQAGITGITGLGIVLVSPPAAAMVQWTRPDISAGSITQPTAIGTGAAWINVGAAGLYDVSYRLGFTGSTVGMDEILVYQTINATGANALQQPNGGTLILASISRGMVGTPPSGMPQPQIAGRYLASLGAGTVLVTWVEGMTGANTSLVPTGSVFSVAKVG